MDWIIIVITVALLVIFLLVRRSGQISETVAAEYLNHGAAVIDVRSPAEFSAGHIPKAINLPLQEIETLIPRRVSDRNQVLLLHCQSGMRSGVAKSKLAALGYTRVYNLGSYDRAARISGAGSTHLS